MPALQVRDVPDDIYEEYKKACETENRSLTQQTLRLIKEYLTKIYGHSNPNGPIEPDYMVGRTAVYKGDSLRSNWRDSIYNPMADEIGRDERIAKREALFKRIGEDNLKEKMHLPPGYSSIAEMIREDREKGYGNA